MPKIIRARDLAEIVTGLLVKPELLGELDSPERYQDFALDIGRVVANHCGGEVLEPEAPASPEDADSPVLQVLPNDSLPSLSDNVWAYHDTDGWTVSEGLKGGALEFGEALTRMTVLSTRNTLQGLLSNEALDAGENQVFEFSLTATPDGNEPVHQGGDRPYSVVAHMGNAPSFEFFNESGEPCFGLMIDITQGVPAVHIDDDGGDAALHVLSGPDGLVLTPEDPSARFEPASPSRFTYNEPGSLLLNG